MSTQKTRIKIKLTSGEQITVQDLPKNRIKKALLERVLPQQVPDAEVLAVCDCHGSPVLSNSKAPERFGLDLANTLVLTDVVAYSKQHDTLFLIEAVHGFGSIDSYRYAELCVWTSYVKCKTAFVSVFASREKFVAQMSKTEYGTHVWFADEPKHSAYLSGSVEASTRFLDARFAARAAVR